MDGVTHKWSSPSVSLPAMLAGLSDECTDECKNLFSSVGKCYAEANDEASIHACDKQYDLSACTPRCIVQMP